MEIKLEYIQKNDCQEENDYFQKSISKITDIENIEWKPCREILNKKDVRILPEKIGPEHFTQGNIGDCYFISCIKSLSQIPQLLHFIMGLTDKNLDNINPKQFKVNFFIDGEWKTMIIKDSFPCINKRGKYELIGVKPNDNELFMMILEKAWALLNGGYDQIEGGNRLYIFELFLGASSKYFYTTPRDSEEKMLKSINRNENYFGTLSLCGADYYRETEDLKKKINNNEINPENYDKNKLLREKLIKKGGKHAYCVLKSFEIQINDKENTEFILNKCNSYKFLVIFNPHGKTSNLIGSGVELNEIENIINDKFGENSKQCEHIIKNNKKYKDTGVISMPIDYFLKWSYGVSVCYPHFGFENHKIKGELEYLYVFKLEITEEQAISSQICFHSYRAHRDEIDKINIYIKGNELDNKNERKKIFLLKNLLLNYNYCGFLMIKSDREQKKFNIIKKKIFIDENNRGSIMEINKKLKNGIYFIMMYFESSIDKCIINFFSEKKLKSIELIQKFDIKKKDEKNFEKYTNEQKSIINSIKSNKTEEIINILFDEKNYRYFLNSSKKEEIEFTLETHLPLIKEYYSHFRKISETLKLNPDEAIFRISDDGEAQFYDIIEPRTYETIFKGKNTNGQLEKMNINISSLSFRDINGYPYQVKDMDEAIKEIKLNKEPISCLFSQYDENFETLESSIEFINIYHNNSTNDDIILVKTNKKGEYKKRDPLLVIILDVSSSMNWISQYLQNEVIYKLLIKLGYDLQDEDKDNFKKLKELNINNFEILQAISSEIKLKAFYEKYSLENEISKEWLKSSYKKMILLITFSKTSNLYLFNISDFQNCSILESTTYFYHAGEILRNLLKNISMQKSVRLLNISDGEISDSEKSIEFLEKILKKDQRHQMNSVPVLIGENGDKRLLIKLSTFCFPIKNMEQININNKDNSERDAEIIYRRFIDDGMEYFLTLYSDNPIKVSNDFTRNYITNPYIDNQKENIFRTDRQRKKSEYEEIFKKMNPKKIKEYNEIKPAEFYKLIKELAPFLSQLILEKKINGKNEENEEIINYFFKTESSFLKNYPKLKTINELFKKIKNDKIDKEEIPIKLKEFKEEAINIIKFNLDLLNNKGINNNNDNNNNRINNKIKNKINNKINNANKNNNGNNKNNRSMLSKDINKSLSCINIKGKEGEKKINIFSSLNDKNNPYSIYFPNKLLHSNKYCIGVNFNSRIPYCKDFKITKRIKSIDDHKIKINKKTYILFINKK